MNETIWLLLMQEANTPIEAKPLARNIKPR